MAIEFHCEHCGKMIRSANEHAGKHGKCPSCHQDVYIPSPPEELEPLKLAPIDPKLEADRQRLLREGRDLATRLMKEKDTLPPEPSRPTPAAAPMTDPRLKLDMETLVTEYAICMHDGALDEAEELAREIRKDPKAAEDVMQRITIDEIPPTQLAGIKRPLLLGFFKQLRERK